ncbi:glycosyltransferase [Kitasatospora sp. NPDC004614]|uniref:glycosyltransferase n=1 Tax=unclassified Kitasatospora TaxID=2633591 RepID=UPI0036830682
MRVLLCPLSDPGFLYPVVAVGVELRNRGHDVTMIGRPAAADVASSARLDFLSSADYGATRSFNAAHWYQEGAEQYTAVRCAGKESRPDVLITSILCHGALLAAESLNIPVIVMGLAAYLWPYTAGGDAEPQLHDTREWRLKETFRHYSELRSELGLGPIRTGDLQSPLIGDQLLLRGHADLELPGAILPERVRNVGPCWWEPPPSQVDMEAVNRFLDSSDKPLLYVHLGRTFGRKGASPDIARFFSNSPFRVAIEVGRNDPVAVADFEGRDLLLVRKPWMTPIVKHADLVVSNATTSPVLCALLHKRPQLVSPVGGEQPVLAKACVRAGVAAPLPTDSTPVSALEKALADSVMRSRVEALSAELCDIKSAAVAADIVEATAR